MVANQYQPGKLFRRFHLQKVEKNSSCEENTENDDATVPGTI